jgi:hypothetical protein
MSKVFIHIPKTAGTSIRHWMKENQIAGTENPIVNCYGHATLKQVEQENGQFDWSFAVVRNTYERLASLYLYSWNKSKRRMEKAIKRNAVDEANTFIVKQAEKGVENFFKVFIEDGRSELAGGLWMSQLEYVDGVDYVLMHHNLIEDFKVVQTELNCFTPLTQNRNYMGSEKAKLNLYTPQYIKLVDKYFGEEIERFKFIVPS